MTLSLPFVSIYFSALPFTFDETFLSVVEIVVQPRKTNLRNDFLQLPNVTSALYNITMLMKGNIVSEVSQGKESFLKIQKDIQHAVNQTIPMVSASIRRAGDNLTNIADNITALIDRITVQIDTFNTRHLDVARTHIDQYSLYR